MISQSQSEHWCWVKHKIIVFTSADKQFQPAVLPSPWFVGLIILDTDASDQSLGAKLSQVQNGKEVPIIYASKTISSTRRHYYEKRIDCIHTIIQILPSRSALYC